MYGQSLNRRRVILTGLAVLATAGLRVAEAAETGAVTVAGTELVMAEQRGCIYCARWNAQIAPIYPKTAEGRAAPLRRVDIHTPLPSDLTFAAPLRITPTFVLMRDGREVSRLEGYPGEDFFWGLLQRMLTQAEVPHDGTG